MADQQDNEESGGGVVDAVSIAYIIGGIPAMVAFFVILFLLTQWFNIPA